jgi:hypothetical protein
MQSRRAILLAKGFAEDWNSVAAEPRANVAAMRTRMLVNCILTVTLRYCWKIESIFDQDEVMRRDDGERESKLEQKLFIFLQAPTLSFAALSGTVSRPCYVT